MFQIILIIIILGIIALLIIAAKQRDDFRYSRSTTINSIPAKVFEHVNSQRKWQEWNPWAKIDPNAKFDFEGPESGVGAISKWDGNNQVGKGISTITISHPHEFIQLKLEFIRPMKAINTAEFTFTPQDNFTVVTWSMYGKNTYIGKIVSLILNCEKMVTGQFDKGLANLKGIVESEN